MSLLLDALRRAAASKQDAPESDQYVAPRRDDVTFEGEAEAGTDSTSGGKGQADLMREVPWDESRDDSGAELTLEPEIDSDEDDRTAAAAPAERGRQRDAGTTRSGGASQPAARALLGARAGRRRHRHGVLLGLGGILVAAVVMAGGAWWFYTESRQAAEQGLAAFEPTAEPLVQLPADEASGRAGDSAAAGDTTSASAGDESKAASDEGAEPPAASEAATATAEAPAADEAVAVEEPEVAGTAEPRDEATEDGDLQAEAEPALPAQTEAEAPVQAEAKAPARAEAVEPEGDAIARTARPVVQVDRSSNLARLLNDGYAALRAGQLEVAARAYGEARDRAPGNRDALLGLASIAQRRGEVQRAAELYQRILVDNPLDPHARAGLASLAGASRPRLSETELKRLLAEQPESASWHFALGNVYATESRWSEAQRAYFKAYRAASDNAEYAYNLAVALDHLGQRAAALEHYEEALAGTEATSVGFSVEQVRRRIAQLQ